MVTGERETRQRSRSDSSFATFFGSVDGRTLGIALTIGLFGVFVSAVTFGVLRSSAEGEVQGITVGGAIAGAVVTWLVVGALYIRLKKSSDVVAEFTRRTETEIAALRRQNTELQRKVMRGLSMQEGFTPESVDRQRIVLAHPEDWVALGGTVFQLMAPDSTKALELDDGQTVDMVDVLPASFILNHYTLEGEGRYDDPEATYAMLIKQLEADPSVVGYTAERVKLGAGGDPNAGYASLKVITSEAMWVKLQRDPVLGNIDRQWGPLTFDSLQLIGAYLTEKDELGESTPRDFTEQDEPIADEPASVEPVFTEDEEIEIEVLLDTLGEPRMTLARGPEHIAFSRGRLSELHMPIVVQRMRVLCVNPDIGKIFEFDFVDDAADFEDATATFNAILDSVRFLPKAV